MSNSVVERRSLEEPVEFRAKAGKKLSAAGYASVFEKRSQNLGGFVEQVAPGAFSKTLKEADVRALLNHDPSMLLGRTASGTLTLSVDERGLWYEVDLPDTSVGRDTAALIERGDITGSSFGFRMIEDEWGETEDGFPLRTLKQVALRDVSPVTYPAYTDSDVTLRALSESRSLDLETLIEAFREGELQRALTTENGPSKNAKPDSELPSKGHTESKAPKNDPEPEPEAEAPAEVEEESKDGVEDEDEGRVDPTVIRHRYAHLI